MKRIEPTTDKAELAKLRAAGYSPFLSEPRSGSIEKRETIVDSQGYIWFKFTPQEISSAAMHMRMLGPS